ncbi:Sugar kinase of the NBD/HSP70 family, may contain an N-terminal HTH domain [Loktanella fryxellensis]|uniref:Sugar kinase of the NBD/HSP70 family, may contain an N-terminal HTH domain n=1 Tax=Loktanella fryxellensis TaxID=245187 RepID=A0A1H8BRF2_9RHOB|nr:ROK family protein [Loktanella fryxellensis]SEM85356.1 Sugar kinase of the NBD/HSP70 family, may contain an N-terminal HTH domain [Loktanella fryxellensis]
MYDAGSDAGKGPASGSAVTGCGPLMPSQADRGNSLRQQVFVHVRAMGQVSRADIARGLGISAGSVTAITADLIQAGVLLEIADQPREGPREAGRGRPPVALAVAPQGRIVVGIKVADTRHSAVLADFAGNILSDLTLPVRQPRKPAAALVTELGVLVDRLLAQAGRDRGDLIGVGLGISGIVEHETGLVAWSPLIAGRDVALGQLLAARLDVAVQIDNDANVLTLAELWFGAGRDRTDFAVVTVEHGVGMGLVLDNRLFRGSRGMGMELGHTKVALDGALCRCGQRGCLEAYLADYALAREAATALDRVPAASDHDTMIEALYAEARAGNAAAATIFRRAGRYLALGLANVVQLFDPALIILAGERMRYDYLYSDAMLREMQALTLSEGRTTCAVATQVWGDLVWARGATALALTCATQAVLGP